ncbi:hypothetical protein Q31a_16130 [Aureliella helgolandensis]|uniref:Uncharacterized protein n=1 Tax=Aureliella helgolandensis TaxID=2527968 RepID=A0A518G416_9BACT|nr:hypothetical protein Q31a_16130 [Aureliella helgolandensis]
MDSFFEGRCRRKGLSKSSSMLILVDRYPMGVEESQARLNWTDFVAADDALAGGPAENLTRGHFSN